MALSSEGRGSRAMFLFMSLKNAAPLLYLPASKYSECFSMPVRNHVTGSMKAS